MPKMRKIGLGLALLLLLASFAATGCDLVAPDAKDTTGATVTPGVSPEPTAEPEPGPAVRPEPGVEPTLRPLPDLNLVTVPDVVQAIKEYEFANSYEDDPDAVAVKLRSFVSRYLESRGLKGKCVLQPITMNDRQLPVAGTLAPKGTLVRVYVGFGD